MDKERWRNTPPYGGRYDFVVKYSASCFCKRVKFCVSTDPVASKICDCSICMRLHGAPAQWAALFDQANVRFDTRSLMYLRWYNTEKDEMYTEGATRMLPCKLQCNHCGTWVAEEGRQMFRTFPTLFEFVTGQARPIFPKSFLPQSHIFCATRALEYDDGLPCFLDEEKTPLTIGDYLLAIAPRLDGCGYKGQAGRICILGGSVDYAGAPYYAGMAALRVGAELVYVCTAEEATGPIKSYSPELMVSEIYRWSRISSESMEIVRAEQERMVSKMEALLPRLHALVIGPGLGRDDRVLDGVARVILAARAIGLPLVIDADGLWLIEKRPDLVKGYTAAVLTPNAAEYRRLAKRVCGDEAAELIVLCHALGGPMVLQKGAVDLICGPEMQSTTDDEPPAHLECAEPGAPRRPGGLGDFLAGSLSVLLGWAALRQKDPLLACQAACVVVRRACLAAFEKKKRSMVAPDVLEEVGPVFEALCPAR